MILALGISLGPAIANRKKIPTELLAIWVIYLLYLGFTSIVRAGPRYLIAVMPFWVLWIGYIYHTFTDIRLNAKRN
jgi:hypothetical protein